MSRVVPARINWDSWMFCLPLQKKNKGFCLVFWNETTQSLGWDDETNQDYGIEELR